MNDDIFTNMEFFSRHYRVNSKAPLDRLKSVPRRSVHNLRTKFADALDYDPSEKYFFSEKIAKISRKSWIFRLNFFFADLSPDFAPDIFRYDF